MAAIGVTLVYAPALPILYCMGAWHIDVAIALCLLQFVGAILWVSGISQLRSWAVEQKVKIGGLDAVQGGAICLGVSALFMMFYLGGMSSYDRNDFFAGICVLTFIASSITLWVGTARLREFLPPLNLAKVSCIMSTFFFICLFLMVSTESMVGAFGTIIYILAIVVMAILGWWNAVAYAPKAEKLAGQMSQPEAEVSVTAAPEPETFGPPPFIPNAASGSGATLPDPPRPMSESDINYLMSLRDEVLEDMIKTNHPRYSREAARVLDLRQAWEQIKDYPDEKLNEMLSAPEGMISDAVLDASSMELYQRRSPSFMDQIAQLPLATIKEMARGDGYYDGYVRAAREILNNK